MNVQKISVNNSESVIEHPITVSNYEEDASDLMIGDSSGNVILKLDSGHIQTKNFSSVNSVNKTEIENMLTSEDNVDSYDLVISDTSNNALCVLTDGHIKVKNFNSAQLDTQIQYILNRLDNIPSGGGSSDSDNSQFRFACFGDSITSNAVSGTGSLVNQYLGTTFLKENVPDIQDTTGYGNITTEFGNLAVGSSICCDYFSGNTNVTPIRLQKSNDAYVNYNTLSNQVRRLLQHTTPEGQQISWRHPIEGDTYTIPTEYGVGKGYTMDIPDIIYIASGGNDAHAASNSAYGSINSYGLHTPVEDFDTVITQKYSELTRSSHYSALRWAVETLRANYPNCRIFICNVLPRQADRYFEVNELQSAAIKKICDWLGVPLIDQRHCAGVSINRSPLMSSDGVHPSQLGKEISASYIASQIRANFYKLK